MALLSVVDEYAVTNATGPVDIHCADISLDGTTAGVVLSRGGRNPEAVVFNLTEDGEAGLINITREYCTALCFSPTNNLHALANGRQLVLCDNHSRRVVDTLNGSTSPIMCVRFSPDCHLVAAGMVNGDVSLWRLQGYPTGHHILDRDTDRSVTSVTFADSGHVLAVFDSLSATMYRTSNLEILFSVAASRARVSDRTGRPVPDGRSVGMGIFEEAELLDTPAPAIPGASAANPGVGLRPGFTAYSPHPSEQTVKISHDGRLVAVSTFNGVELWNITDRVPIGGTPVAFFETPAGDSDAGLWPTAIAFSPGGKELAAYVPGSIYLRSMETGVVRVIRCNMYVGSLIFTPDGTCVICVPGDDDPDGDEKTLCVLNTESGTCTSVIPGSQCHFVVSPDGRRFVQVGYDVMDDDPGPLYRVGMVAAAAGPPPAKESGVVSQYPLSTGSDVDSILSIGISNNGLSVYVLVGLAGDPGTSVGMIYRHDSAGRLVLTACTGGVYSTAICFSPTDDTHAFADGTNLSVRDSRTNATLYRVGPCPADVCCLAFSADGRELIAGMVDGNIGLWRFRGVFRTHRTLPHGAPVAEVVPAPSGRALLVLGPDGRVTLYSDSGTNEFTKLFSTIPWSGCVRTNVKFVPDGSRLAVSNGPAVELWDAVSVSDAPVTVFDLDSPPSAIAVSPARGLVAACVGDHIVLINPATANKRHIDCGGAVHDIVFTPSGAGMILVPEYKDNGTELRVVDIQSGAYPVTISRSSHMCAFSPGGRRVAQIALSGTGPDTRLVSRVSLLGNPFLQCLLLLILCHRRRRSRGIPAELWCMISHEYLGCLY